MSDWDDLEGVTPPRISNEDAERLLSGTSGIDETRELADLSALLGALRGPAEPAELAGLHSALAGFGASVVTDLFDPPTARTRPMYKKLLTGKAIATIGVVTLLSAGAAAASGGVPSPFASSPSVATATPADADHDDDQMVVDDVSPVVDEDEDSDSLETETDADKADDAVETEPAEPADDVTDDTDGQGPDVNGPAKFGLCTAYAARTKHDDTTTTTERPTPPSRRSLSRKMPTAICRFPSSRLSDAADAAGQTVAEFCADAVPGGKAEAPGKSGDSPSDTAPGKSGDNPSDTAPGQSGGDHGNSGGDHGQSKKP